jgi:hypothetical protein
MNMRETAKDSAAEVGEDGKPTNARLHEEMVAGVDDHDFRMQTKKRLLAAGLPEAALERLLGPSKATSVPSSADNMRDDPLGQLQPLYVVQERDIDFLLLEELHSSPGFVDWFGQRVGLQSAVFDGAWYSVSNADGESDLLLRVLAGKERVGVLIEDKIAASEQPDQDERYHKRGAKGVTDGWFDRYITCICAPQAYLDTLAPESKYGYRLAYEEIADWFTQQQDSRATWRGRVIKAAITQGRKGYTKQVNDAVTKFHIAYYARLRRTQPTLEMSRPTPKGSGGSWIILWVSGWPKTIHLNHKLSRGSVELSFERNSRDQLMDLGIDWPEGVLPITTGGYGSLAITVPAIDVEKPFETQVAAVDEAFAAMQTLVPLARLSDRLSSMVRSEPEL